MSESPLLRELEVIDDAMPRDGALNMAIDEALLQITRTAVLRFYRWQQPTVSFGYFGSYREAQRFAGGRQVVRRWTGGGMVSHGADVTYSILISPCEAAYKVSSRRLYQRIHEIVGEVLRDSFAIETQLVNVADRPRSSACFTNPVVADLLEGSQKIAGAAQRKTRQGLLHQGSIQRNDLPLEFRPLFARRLGDNICERPVNSAVLEHAKTLATDKYDTLEWLRRL